MQQSFFPDSVNAFGIAMVFAFLLCWVGGALSAWAMYRAGDAQYFSGSDSVWSQPEPRKRFLRFIAFAVASLLCGVAALTFGGWPAGWE